MRVSSNVFKSGQSLARSAATKSVVPFARQDLTKRWLGRIQAKSTDTKSQESLMKLSSLVDYYNRPAEPLKENIDWGYWKENIRTAGIVEKISDKFNDYKTQVYNVDSIAQKSAINSERFDNYGLYLKWNYHLWMKQYVENIRTLNGIEALGDITYVSCKFENNF
jgi:hypothetical protein